MKAIQIQCIWISLILEGSISKHKIRKVSFYFSALLKMKVWNGISYCMKGATVSATMQRLFGNFEYRNYLVLRTEMDDWSGS